MAGFEVVSVSLEPRPTSTFSAGTLGARVAAHFGGGRNAPLVLSPTDSGFITDDAEILLEDVVLKYTSNGASGLISLNELMAEIARSST